MSSPNGTFASNFLTPEQRIVLRKSQICSRLDEEQFNYFFEVVLRTRLDPFTGLIKPIIRHRKRSDGTEEPIIIILTTLQGLRTVGDRSGQHEGESAPEWCDKDGVWREVWLEDFPPVAARATVYRKDRKPQITICRWDAYVQLEWDKQGNTKPNRFWRRMGSHMLAKCCLAGGYRGAYPLHCSGLYITEEVSEELDGDSEAGIEAEMLRREAREKAYWDAEREKGNPPIGEAQRPPELYSVDAPNVVKQEPSAEPVRQIDWNDFVITRVELFKGRTVGDLHIGELIGLKSWLEKVERAWANLDEDLKTHYTMISARLEFEGAKELVTTGSSLDFGQ